MAEGILITTDEEIDAALEAAKHEAPEPAAASASYLADAHLLLICLKSGQRLAVPVEDLEDIKGATDDQLSEIELLGSGTAIHFTRFGHGVYVPYIVEGAYGSKIWMNQLREKRESALLSAA